MDNHKLFILNRKAKADFLQNNKASINIELDNTPVTLNQDDTLTVFRNQVNQKFPPELLSSNNRTKIRVNEVGFRSGGRGGQSQG